MVVCEELSPNDGNLILATFKYSNDRKYILKESVVQYTLYFLSFQLYLEWLYLVLLFYISKSEKEKNSFDETFSSVSLSLLLSP